MSDNQIVATTAERLRQALEYRHINAAQVAKDTGISKGSLSQYISGKFNPKQDRLYTLAKYLRVSPLWLMGIDVPMEIIKPKEFYPIDNVRLTDKNNQMSYTQLYEEFRELAEKVLPMPEDMKLIDRIRFLTPANKAVVTAMVETMIENQFEQQKTPIAALDRDSSET